MALRSGSLRRLGRDGSGDRRQCGALDVMAGTLRHSLSRLGRIRRIQFLRTLGKPRIVGPKPRGQQYVVLAGKQPSYCWRVCPK